MRTTIVFAVAMLVGTVGFAQSTSSNQNETTPKATTAKKQCAPKAGASCCSKAMSKNCAPKSGTASTASATESKGTKEENSTTTSGASKG